MIQMRASIVTLAVWLAVTGGSAWWYVRSRLALPDLEGYEKHWDWQLMFFGLTRLPLFIVVLLIALWLERRYLANQ
jgi:hypothetical protein